MERRNLGMGLMVLLASSLLTAAGSASARTGGLQAAAGIPGCKVDSLPSFMAQGEFKLASSVGDVIEVSCNPLIYSAGAEVTVNAAQLHSRCNWIAWAKPGDQGRLRFGLGPKTTLHLDADGNANVGLLAGPNCMPGESLITVDENSPPYETFTTSFQVLPSLKTPPGLFIMPAAQVEDAETSSVITIAQAEFSGASEKHVRIGAKQLSDRCEKGIGVWIVGPSAGPPVVAASEVAGPVKPGLRFPYERTNAIQLDNDGNGFVLLIGSNSCAEGTSLIEADLEESPFSTATGTFTIEAPRVR